MDRSRRLTLGAPASVLPDVDPVDDVVWADRGEGISAVWFIDHLLGWVPHGVDGGAVSDPHAVMDPFALMGAAARASSRVEIGVAVTDPLRRSPVALAQAALTIGWLGGRPGALGLGTGADHNLAPFGLARARKLEYLERACGEISGYLGNGAPPPGGALGISSVAAARLFVAAHGPKAIDLAARYGQGWLPAGLPVKPFGSRLRLLRERAEIHGRDPESIRPALLLWAALAESRDESLAMLERPFVRAVSLYGGKAAFERYGAAHPAGGAYRPDELTAAEVMAMIDRIPLQVACDAILSGSVEEVAERLGAYADAGCEHVIIYDIGRYLSSDGVPRSRACLSSLARMLGAGRP